MITRKNFIPTVCIAYTILVVGKIFLETILSKPDGFYRQNLLFMFLVCVVATFLLSLNTILNKIPLLIIMIGQYILLILFVFLSLSIISFWEPVDAGGYWDMFRSVTVPYVFLAVFYYYSYFREIKKANKIIQEIQKKELN